MSDKEGSPSSDSDANDQGSPVASNHDSPKVSVSRSASHSSHSKSRSRSISEEKRPKKKSKSKSRSNSRSRRRYSRSPDRNGARKSRSYRSRSRSNDRRRSRDDYDYHESKGRNYGYDRHSPFSHRKRHRGDRVSNDKPLESRCLGVFGLSLHTTERDLREIFGRYGPVEDIQVVYDHQTGRSRGFAFIYMRHVEDAVEAKERAPGSEIDGRRIRVDYSITDRAHTPTPGVYLGRPAGGSSRGRGSYGGSGYYKRSPPSDHYGGSRRRYSRSRSRSYSPRRY